MKVEWVPLGDVLTPDLDPVVVDAATTYPSAGLLNRGRGLFRRPDVLGSETRYPRLFRLKAGQIVYSKLFGWEGSTALVSEEFDGLFVSSEFPTFALTSGRLRPEYLSQYMRSASFMADIAVAAGGLGQRRQRVNPDSFLEIRVPLPNGLEQDRIVAHLGKLAAAGARQDDVAQSLIAGLIEGAVRSSPRFEIGSILRRRRDWLELQADQRYSPIGVRGFGRGMIRYETVAADGLSRLRYYHLVPLALLVSNIKAWEGAVTTVERADEGRVASNRFLQYVSRDDPQHVDWVRRYLLTPEGIAALGHASPGSADRNRTLSMDSFEAIGVPMPSGAVIQKLLAAATTADTLNEHVRRRNLLGEAVVPAARREIFDAMR